MKKLYIFSLIGILMLGVFASCEDLDDSIGTDPYGGGKEPLGIKLLSQAPVPSSGVPGDTILFHAKGLSAWCNPSASRYDFKMYMGDEEVEIVDATDSTLLVKVPQEVSTGITYLVLQNQVFYGPTFTVNGNVSIDTNYGLYKNQKQFSGAIYDAMESKQRNQGGTFYIVGDFSYKINNSWTTCHGIGLVDGNGNITNATNNYFECLNGTVVQSSDGETTYPSSISLLSDNRMLVSGMFSNFYVPLTKNQQLQLGTTGNTVNADNICLLSPTALADTMQVTFSDSYTTSGTTVTYLPLPVSRFNGGFQQQVVRSFVVPASEAAKAESGADQQVIAVGNMTQYVATAWGTSYAGSQQVTTDVSGVVRMNLDGSLDDTYRPASLRLKGAQGGTIVDACVDEEGGIIVVGSFTSFDGVEARGIVRLDNMGRVDEAFMSNLQGGTNGKISSVNYNKVIKAIAIAGNFTQVGGHTTQYVALIGKDGKVDEKFMATGFEGGQPTFVSIVSQQKPKLVLSGTFTKYAGIHRPGFLILDKDGVATQRYNVSGTFNGTLHKVLETTTSLGGYGLLLLGDFTTFNSLTVNNAVMLQADFR